MTQELIDTLTKSERKAFKEWLDKRNRRKKDAVLELFCQFEQGNSGQTMKSLGANRFNVNKKRLTDRLLEFLGTKALVHEVGEEVAAIKLLVVSRRLFAHGHHKLAQLTLNKAEKKARELRHLSILNEIYTTAVHYSYQLPSSKRQDLFDLTQKNVRELQREQQINLAHAEIRAAFQDQEFGHSASDFSVNSTIEKIYATYKVKKEEIQNFQTLYHLAQIIDITAFSKKKYYLADVYFADQIEALAGTSVDGEKTLIYHIDSLYLVANIYFRKRRFEKSVVYLNRMESQMSRFKGKYYQSRVMQFTTLMALNQNFLGHPQKALDLIQELKSTKPIRKMMLTTILSEAMIRFQQGDLKTTHQIMASLQHTDKWYLERVGLDWVLNRRYMEVLLHIEMGNTEYAESRIVSLIRKYGRLFKEDNGNPALPFLQLVRRYNNNPAYVHSSEFKESVEKGIPWRTNGEEDLFLMCFYAWLKAKMEGLPLYQTTLSLTNRDT